MKPKWETEPSFEVFTYKGLVCIIKRHPTLKHLCGYVGLWKDSPLYKVHYDKLYHLNVHGALTFSDFFGEGDIWFLGFDCGHSFDYVPGSPVFSDVERYADIEYVRSEVKSLADQVLQSTK